MRPTFLSKLTLPREVSLGLHWCRYDCSSADLNPIGAISKNDLRRFLVWAADHLGYSALRAVEAAPPTAELEPIREGVASQVRKAHLVLSTRSKCTGHRSH